MPSTARSIPEGSAAARAPTSSRSITRSATVGAEAASARRFLGFLDQHDRDAVADRVLVMARQALDELLGVVVLDLAATVRAGQDVQELLVDHAVPPCPSVADGHRSPRMIARTSAVFSSSISGVRASAFSRRSGSVFEGRTLNHQSSYSTVSPSRRSWRPSEYRRASCSTVPCWSVTSELISPES